MGRRLPSELTTTRTTDYGPAMEPSPRERRGWLIFTVVGLALWIGATVAVTVVNDDPSDPDPMLKAFVIGAGCFFGAMFGAALFQQVRRESTSSEARFGKGVAV